MSHILHIDASPRGDRSISRMLSNEFITAWKAAHPDDTVTYRDVGHHPVPHVTQQWIAAAFSPPTEHTPELAQAIRISDELIAELLAADCYVFGTPIYNFSVPSTFKAYIDQIVRVERTFVVENDSFKGLLSGKKVLVIVAQGGNYKLGTPAAAYNHIEPFLRTVFEFIGIANICFIYANGLHKGNEAREKGLASAREAMQVAIANW